MFKLAALSVAEELTSHWSDSLMLSAMIVALHIAIVIQFGLCAVFLVVWTALRVRSSVERAQEKRTTEKTE